MTEPVICLKMPSLCYTSIVIITLVRLKLVANRSATNSSHHDLDKINVETYEVDYSYSSYQNDSVFYQNYSLGNSDFDLYEDYEEQGISDIKLLVFNPLVPLGKMVTVSFTNTTFKPFDYAFIIRTTPVNNCERVIRIRNSLCRFNMKNYEWYIRLYVRSTATQDLNRGDISVEQVNAFARNSTQFGTVCRDWTMNGDCSSTEVFHTYTVCKPITGQSIPFWSPEYAPHSESFDCLIGCPSNCSCFLRDGILRSSCLRSPPVSTGIVWNAPNQEDYCGIKLHGNISSIGRNAFMSYSFRDGVIALLIISEQQSIRIIEKDAFSGFGNLAELILSYNGIRKLPNGSFNHLWNLAFLELGWNELEFINVDAFSHLHHLQGLSLRQNHIHFLPVGLFSCLSSLVNLKLQSNRIHQLQFELFLGLERLETLDLSNNQIHELQSFTFGGLKNLKFLYLNENGIKMISEKSFDRHDEAVLESQLALGVPCYLYDNYSLHALQFHDRYFGSPSVQQQNMKKIDQENTSWTRPLEVIRLYGNNIQYFTFGSFIGLTNTSVEVDNDWLCCFLKNSTCVVPTRERKTNNFLTCNRLLPSFAARILLWVFCCFALFGNLVVITWQLHLKVRENVQTFLIANLAVSDLIMGMYMLIIASADIYYGDYFPARTETWRNSGICLLAGTLSIISSELSMLLVSLISVDRLMGIRFTFSSFRLNVKRACVAVTVLWIVSFTLGLIPVFAKSSLNYELSEVCVALPLSMKVIYTQTGGISIRRGVTEYYYSVTKSGMYYSIAVFIGLNSLCCLIIALCYIWIFVTVQMTTRSCGRQRDRKEEVNMAMKMAVIVLTDFCCWVPVIIMGILVQAGIQEIPPVANAWIVTLVMPINSAINPFLYTLATVIADRYRKTRSKLRLRYSVKHPSDYTTSNHSQI